MAATTFPGDCPSDFSIGYCGCVPQTPIEGGCSTPPGYCSDECGTKAGVRCEDDIDCISSTNPCSPPERCSEIQKSCQQTYGSNWRVTSGDCPFVGQQCCEQVTANTGGSTNSGKSSWATIENPLKYDNFQDILGAVANFLWKIGLALAPVMLIIAGFMFVTSGGSPERVAGAKKMMLYTLIGLAIILLASGLIAVLKSIIGITS